MLINILNVIKRLLIFCSSRRIGNLCALLIIVIFAVLSLTRNYDFKTFESILKDVGNDWGTYARYGLDIKENGLLLRSAGAPYAGPASFLYNYFIFICLAIFGEKSLPIFVAQHLMLGLSVSFVYWTFRDKMSNIMSLAFLWTLFFFALKDVYKNYSCLPLSENLVLLIVSIFFFCFIKGFEQNRYLLQLMSAVLLGLSILTRPNLFVFAIVLIPVVALYYIKNGKGWPARLIIFIVVLLLSFSLLALRNYLLIKQFHFLPTNLASLESLRHYHPIPPSVNISGERESVLYTKFHFSHILVRYIKYMVQAPHLFFGFYLKKFLFCLGFLPLLSPGFAVRSRWLYMWTGYFTYLFLHIKNHEKWELWEIAVHLYIVFYYGTLIMTAPIHNYGFRMLLPGLFFVLTFAFMALDRLFRTSLRISSFSSIQTI